MPAQLALTVLLEDDLVTLNRAIGIIRRHNLDVASLSLGPGGRVGERRVTLLVTADEAAAGRLVQQLRKVFGVRLAEVVRDPELETRELVLIRVRTVRERHAQLLDVVGLFDARIVTEGTGELTIEAVGSPSLVVSLLRALEPFGILGTARSGPLTLTPASAPEPRASVPEPAPALRPPAACAGLTAESPLIS